MGSDALKSKLRNLGWLTVEETVRLVVGLVFTVIVARKLGPDEFGIYAYIISFVTIFGPLARFGLEAHVTREAASLQPSGGGLFVSFAASTIMTIVAALLTMLAYWTSENPPGATVALLTVALPILLIAPFDLLAAFLKGRESMKALAITRMVATLFYLLAFVVVLFVAPNTRNFVILRSLEIGLLAAAAVVGFLSIGRVTMRRIRAVEVRDTLISAFPLMLALFFGTALLRLDQVLLGLLSSGGALGNYAVAARIFEIGIIAPSILQSTVFGAMVRNHQSANDGLEPHMQSVFDAFSLAGWGAAVGFWIVAALVVEPVFGGAYAGAVPMLHILLLGMPFYFLYFAFNAELTAIGSYWAATALPAVGVMTNILLNLVLIPRFGGEGAACASVFSYIAAGIGASLILVKHRKSSRKMIRALNPVGALNRLTAIYARVPRP